MWAGGVGDQTTGLLSHSRHSRHSLCPKSEELSELLSSGSLLDGAEDYKLKDLWVWITCLRIAPQRYISYH